MNARRMLIHSMGVALLFSMSAFAQDAGSTAGQGGSQNTPTAEKPAKMHNSGAKDWDKMFAKKAAEGGMTEVDLGNYAKENASSDAVKQFGERMVTDHSKANDELKSLAQQKNWTLPTEVKGKDEAMKDRLTKKKGEAFDKAYMRDMVMDHKKDVADFKKCADSCKDPDLKQWAGKTLPTLEEHLKLAKDTAEQVGALKGTSAKASHEKNDHDKDDKGSGSGKPSGAIQ